MIGLRLAHSSLISWYWCSVWIFLNKKRYRRYRFSILVEEKIQVVNDEWANSWPYFRIKKVKNLDGNEGRKVKSERSATKRRNRDRERKNREVKCRGVYAPSKGMRKIRRIRRIPFLYLSCSLFFIEKSMKRSDRIIFRFLVSLE